MYVLCRDHIKQHAILVSDVERCQQVSGNNKYERKGRVNICSERLPTFVQIPDDGRGSDGGDTHNSKCRLPRASTSTLLLLPPLGGIAMGVDPEVKPCKPSKCGDE